MRLNLFVTLAGPAALGTWGCINPSDSPVASVEPHSSEARPLGLSWASCGFPPEAKAAVGIVSLRVLVSANGAPSTVEIISAPESAFAVHARRCALLKTYRPATTATGEAIAAYTPTFLVRFQR
jgi:hypothetical protein